MPNYEINADGEISATDSNAQFTHRSLISIENGCASSKTVEVLQADDRPMGVSFTLAPGQLVMWVPWKLQWGSSQLRVVGTQKKVSLNVHPVVVIDSGDGPDVFPKDTTPDSTSVNRLEYLPGDFVQFYNAAGAQVTISARDKDGVERPEVFGMRSGGESIPSGGRFMGQVSTTAAGGTYTLFLKSPDLGTKDGKINVGTRF